MNQARTPSVRAYAVAAVLTLLSGLAVIWLWVAAVPLAFLDPEYPPFLAKRELVEHCDLGAVLVLGDSRAAADIMPNRLGVSAANLAVGGGSSVEAY